MTSMAEQKQDAAAAVPPQLVDGADVQSMLISHNNELFKEVQELRADVASLKAQISACTPAALREEAFQCNCAAAALQHAFSFFDPEGYVGPDSVMLVYERSADDQRRRLCFSYDAGECTSTAAWVRDKVAFVVPGVDPADMLWCGGALLEKMGPVGQKALVDGALGWFLEKIQLGRCSAHSGVLWSRHDSDDDSDDDDDEM